MVVQTCVHVCSEVSLGLWCKETEVIRGLSRETDWQVVFTLTSDLNHTSYTCTHRLGRKATEYKHCFPSLFRSVVAEDVNRIKMKACGGEEEEEGLRCLQP